MTVTAASAAWERMNGLVKELRAGRGLANHAAELAAALVVMAASMLGLPVSSTHILIGAILGIGIVNRSANWRLMKPIALAWVITLPAAALIASCAALTLNFIWG